MNIDISRDCDGKPIAVTIDGVLFVPQEMLRKPGPKTLSMLEWCKSDRRPGVPPPDYKIIVDFIAEWQS